MKEPEEPMEHTVKPQNFGEDENQHLRGKSTKSEK